MWEEKGGHTAVKFIALLIVKSAKYWKRGLKLWATKEASVLEYSNYFGYFEY